MSIRRVLANRALRVTAVLGSLTALWVSAGAPLITGG